MANKKDNAKANYDLKKTKITREKNKSIRWNDRELAALAEALQLYGFAETKKISEFVKTKDENSVKYYIKTRTRDTRVKLYKEKLLTPLRPNPWYVRDRLDLNGWPILRKWRKMVRIHMLPCVRSHDCSMMIMRKLLKKFYDEQDEPADPQVINVKAIYKYLMDSISSEVPAQLPPVESAIVLMMLKQLREMKDKFDLKEELDFIRKFRKVTTFAPFEVKDEFRKKIKKEVTELKNSSAVLIPSDLYSHLSRHRKIVQSFNPLMVPLWLLDKEQDCTVDMFKSSAVDKESH